MKYLVFAAAFGAIAAPASAWEETTDFRGLHIYTASSEGISAVAVCDPDGAFIPPTNHLTMEIEGQFVDGEYLIKTPAASHDGSMVGGSAIDRDAQDWTALVTVLRSGSQIDVQVEGKTFRLETGSPFPVTCGADI